MVNILYIILALVAFGVLIFLHELGHYFVAKKEGMEIEVFSIGFGKPLLQWKWQGVEWKICLFLFGGYVQIKGQGVDSKSKQDPYKIKNGFFGKGPLSRIKVALAGPLVNLVFAFVCFSAIYFLGGREKPFAAQTKIVGYVASSSKLYNLGMRPGDMIETIDDKPIEGGLQESLLHAAVTSSEPLSLGGYHIDPIDGHKTPFTIKYSLKLDPDNREESLSKARALLPASYLFYSASKDPFTRFSGSPMQGKKAEVGDRLLWIDGSYLFSAQQLHQVLRQKKALLTIDRDGKTLLFAVPRVPICTLYLTAFEKDELEDWAYDGDFGSDFEQRKMIPYFFNSQGVIQRVVDQKDALLQKGDRILAVDTESYTQGKDILKALQTHKTTLILQRDGLYDEMISSQTQDQFFEKTLQRALVAQLAQSIGTKEAKTHLQDLYLITSIEPKTLEQFATSYTEKEEMGGYISQQRSLITAIHNPEKRAEGLRQLSVFLAQPRLGIPLRGLSVNHNPNPIDSFVSVCKATWTTLKGLIVGDVSPKWLSGPLGIVTVVHHSFSISFKDGLFWLAAISINLGLLNLLPIPVLDGGHICFALYEWVTKKRVSVQTMQRLTVPFVLLMIFIFVFTTFQDLGHLLHRFF